MSLCSTEQIFQVSGVIWGGESLYLELCECSIAAPLQRPIVRRIRRVNLHRDIHRRRCEQRRSVVRVAHSHSPSRPLLHSHVLTSGSAAASEVAGGMAVPSTRSVEAVSSPMAPRLP